MKGEVYRQSINQYRRAKASYGKYRDVKAGVKDVWEGGGNLKSLLNEIESKPDEFDLNSVQRERLNGLATNLRHAFERIETNEGVNPQIVDDAKIGIDRYYRTLMELLKDIFGESSEQQNIARQKRRSVMKMEKEVSASPHTVPSKILSDKEKRLLEYSFALKRNVDISVALIQHVMNVAKEYTGNQADQKVLNDLLRLLKSELDKYHENKCRIWLLYFTREEIPSITDRRVRNILMKFSPKQICEEIDKIFEENKKSGDFTIYFESCKKILRPHLEDLTYVADAMLGKEGIRIV